LLAPCLLSLGLAAASLAAATGIPIGPPVSLDSLDSTASAAIAAADSAAMAAIAAIEVPPPSDAALRYYRSGKRLWVARWLWTLAIPLLVLGSGWARRMGDAGARLPWGLPVLVTFMLWQLLSFLTDLPWAYGVGFVRSHAYGLSVQTLGKWASDLMKGFGVELALGLPAVACVFFLLRRFPRSWWFWLACLVAPLTAALLYLSPLVIDPLFNDFRPLADRALEARILDVAQRAGIEDSRVFEVAKSVDTTAINAYVTGFGSSHRIVLWDTLLKKLDADEVVAVMAHEIGHYALGHILTGILFAALASFAGFYAAYRLAGWFHGRYGSRFRLANLADPATIPLWALVGSLVGFAGQPAGLAFSRYQEHEADRFALEMTRDNRAVAGAFVKLQRENLTYPFPERWVVLLRSSHPPLGERVEFANAYRPWERGEPARYSGRFRPADRPPAAEPRDRRDRRPAPPG
jgi:Zn-dependent protease with chaperone function